MSIKKTFIAFLACLLLPISAFAQMTVVQGGTGLTSVPAGSFLAGLNTLHLTATSSPYFSSFTFGLATGTSATTTNLAVTGITSHLLKTNSLGSLVAAISNTDYQAPISLTTTGSSGAATFDGTTLNIPQYTGGSGTVSTSTSETSGYIPFWTTTSATPALLSGGVSGFTFDSALTKLTVTNASTTSFSISDLGNALYLGKDTNGTASAYAGTSCTNQFVRSLSGVGAATCATVGASDVSLAALTAGSGLTSAGTYTGATARTFAIDFTSGNVWTAASSTFTGGLTIGTSTTTSATTTNMFSTTASSTNLFTSSLGVASSTPTTKLSVGAGAITVAEYQPATSTSMTIDWRNGNQQLVRIGTSAITMSFSNYVEGQKLVEVICNPASGTAGTITWPSVVLWAGGTTPTQTTTANKCDIWSFLATNGTSTLKVLGAQNASY